MGHLNVFMVAEKPSLAKSIAESLSENRSSSSQSNMATHTWEGQFKGTDARFKMTSVIGHVFNIDFHAKYQSWDKTDPADLFWAETVRSEATPKARVVKHLENEARGADVLVLWLDCDREGENICFEVIDCVKKKLAPGHRILRARFSALSSAEIKKAMENLGKPNKHEALSVDARQELDLKLGVAFSRFQSRYLQDKYSNLSNSVISFGPCLTPTLNFVVQRHDLIAKFTPEPFWAMKATVTCPSGAPLAVEWKRGRLFDKTVALFFKSMITEHKSFKVTDVVEKRERRNPPLALNTVGLLKACSSSLGIGPQDAMRVAESLYLRGYLSYPRTESTAFPPGFDFYEVLRGQARHPHWGDYATSLMNTVDLSHVKGGVDAGDHPPLTPVRPASDDLGGWDAMVYELVSRHFLAALSPPVVSRSTKIVFAAGQETFLARGVEVLEKGFTSILPSMATQPQILPKISVGDLCPLKSLDIEEGQTGPPDYLTESDLVGLMESNGIGTDASISTHINNVMERGYARIESGRRVVPTPLGITLIHGYMRIDPELCLPTVRAYVEKQLNLVAKGVVEKDQIVAFVLDCFAKKFAHFKSEISRMDELFEASFSPLASTGKALAKCGVCRRFMKLVPSTPSRLFCSTCDETYSVPQGSSIKLYKELTCPLDGFQLCIASLTGRDGKHHIFCPKCYNDPPFENALKIEGGKGGSGMPCSTCEHPTCRHAPSKRGIGADCPQCGAAELVIDPVAQPAIWRVDCPMCDFLLRLPDTLHKAKVLAAETCEACSARLVELTYKKSAGDGASAATKTCILCDEEFASQCIVKHADAHVKRRGARGRGRGRRGRGRGRGRRVNPLLSFERF